MSSPSFVPERGEIWYSDGNSGFYAVHLTNGVWPFTSGAPSPAAPDAGSSPRSSRGLPATGGAIALGLVAVAVLAWLVLRSVRRKL
jgi:hypothetical protein